MDGYRERERERNTSTDHIEDRGKSTSLGHGRALEEAFIARPRRIRDRKNLILHRSRRRHFLLSRSLDFSRYRRLLQSKCVKMWEESNEEALGFGFGRDLYCKIFLSFWRVSTAGNRGIRLYKVGHTDWELRRSSLWSSKPLKLCSWKIKSLVFVWCPSWETHTWRLSPDPRFCRN